MDLLYKLLTLQCITDRKTKFRHGLQIGVAGITKRGSFYGLQIWAEGITNWSRFRDYKTEQKHCKWGQGLVSSLILRKHFVDHLY